MESTHANFDHSINLLNEFSNLQPRLQLPLSSLSQIPWPHHLQKITTNTSVEWPLPLVLAPKSCSSDQSMTKHKYSVWPLEYPIFCSLSFSNHHLLCLHHKKDSILLRDISAITILYFIKTSMKFYFIINYGPTYFIEHQNLHDSFNP